MQVIPFTNNPKISTSSVHFRPENASISLSVSKQAWGFGQMRLYPSSEGFVCANECSSKETCIEFFTHFLLNLPSQESFVLHSKDFKNVRQMNWDDFYNLLAFQKKKTNEDIDLYMKAAIKRKQKFENAEEDEKARIEKDFQVKSHNLNNHYFSIPEILNVFVNGTKITYAIKVAGLFECLVLVIDVSKLSKFKYFDVFYDTVEEFNPLEIPLKITTDYDEIEDYFRSVIGFALSERHCVDYGLNIEQIIVEGNEVTYPTALLSEKMVNVSDIGNLQIHMEATSGYIFHMRVQEGEKTYHIGFVDNVVRMSQYGEIVDKRICLAYDCPEDLIYRAFAKIFNEMALEDD